MYVVAYETSSLIYHAKPYCYVCKRCLFSLSLKIEMAEKQDSFIHRTLDFRFLKQTGKVLIQTLVNRIFVTQDRSKARVTFAYVSFA